MFVSHIQYYAYDNTEGDEFGVGYLGSKEYWIQLINHWNRNDGIKTRYTAEQWEDVLPDHYRGCVLAEVEPSSEDYLVTWTNKGKDYVVRIGSNNKLTWDSNETKLPSIPRWINRLKNQLRDAQS